MQKNVEREVRSDPTFVSQADRARFVAEGHWSTDETLPSLVARNARQDPSGLAVVDDGGRSFTHADVDDYSGRLALGLLDRGVGPGDVVGMQLPSRSEATIVATAIQKIGAIVCPLAPVYRERELDYMARKSSMKALFVPGTYRGVQYEAIAVSLRDTVDDDLLIVSLEPEGSHGDVVGIEQLSGDRSGTLSEDHWLSPDDVSAILFTSGTEADPKGILHTSNSLLTNARSISRLLSLNQGDGIFMPSPISHGTGYGFGLLLAAYLGSTLALPGTWDPSAAAMMIEQYQSVYTHGATPFVLDLLDVPDISSQFDLSSLKYFVSGGASVAPGLCRKVADTLGCELLRLYGQTEGFMNTINRPGDQLDRLEQTDGLPAPGVEIAVVDDEGDLAFGPGRGEAVFKGPHRCVGYLDDPERAQAALVGDGWFRSGDLVTIDAGGYVSVSGRRKEVINRGGYKYSPRDVEDVLSTRQDIQAVAIVREQDVRLGEKGCAFVVPAEGASSEDLTVSGLAAFLDEHGVAKYKWPERVVVVSGLPMTGSGKVQKFILEERVESAAGGAGQ